MDSKESKAPLIRIETGRQADFVRYLFARRELLEIKEENKKLKESLLEIEGKLHKATEELDTYLSEQYDKSKLALYRKEIRSKDLALQKKRKYIEELKLTIANKINTNK